MTMTDSDVDASAREHYAQLAADEDRAVLGLDATCPYCKRHSDVGEAFEGQLYRCGHCGKRIFAYVLSDDTMIMGAGETTPSSFSTGRQRTRALWRKRGRR